MSSAEDNMIGLLKVYADYAYWKKWYGKNKGHFNELVNKHKKNRRKEMQKIITSKKDVPCSICGNKFHFSAMDLVHKDDIDKVFRISDATRLIYSIDKLLEEIAKCDVLCANCHRIVKTEEYLAKNGKSQSRKRRIRDLIDNMKVQPCAICGETFPPYAMELDHKDRNDKVDSISKMITNDKPISSIMDECKKTLVFCL